MTVRPNSLRPSLSVFGSFVEYRHKVRGAFAERIEGETGSGEPGWVAAMLAHGSGATGVRQFRGGILYQLLREVRSELGEDLRPRWIKVPMSLQEVYACRPLYDTMSLLKPVVKAVVAGLLALIDPALHHIGWLGVYLALDFAYQLVDRSRAYTTGVAGRAGTLAVDILGAPLLLGARR